MGMKIYTNDLVKGHSDVKVKCLTFGLYTQVSDSGPLGPLVFFFLFCFKVRHQPSFMRRLARASTIMHRAAHAYTISRQMA